MLLGSNRNSHISFGKQIIFIYVIAFLVCLQHLLDPINANAAFERAFIMPDALRNPLIYLNGAIYYFAIGHYDRSQLMLTNLVNMAEQIHMRDEVNAKCMHILIIFNGRLVLQYIHVANTLQTNMPRTLSTSTVAEEATEEFAIVGEPPSS